MRSTLNATEPVETGKTVETGAPVIALPQTFSVEGATLGRKPNNDGDNSGAMWFE
ncbi:hypothetical protein [Streptomyces genisteinicus]|uniref:Uncharacterized protein n=1 Tax=Streptomyces genisteinicus TaxID=2768068 RepID=A0A7H0I2R0_9ACTN|nr:hypothetical protein [Streptomyces genisteinicus]QNP67076.1 hypothetical protein IAG43_32070 [Streptomyces genisteinicus]